MKKMKLSLEEIRLMNALEEVADVSVKDCLITGNLVSFLVREQEVGKAIGKKASNVKLLESKLKKRIEIIGFSENPEKMIEKTFEVKINEVQKKKGKLLVSLDAIEKKKIFNNAGRLRRVKELIKRNYDLDLILS